MAHPSPVQNRSARLNQPRGPPERRSRLCATAWSASTPSPPPRSPALHVRLVDGTQDVLDRVYGHLSQAADWAQEAASEQEYSLRHQAIDKMARSFWQSWTTLFMQRRSGDDTLHITPPTRSARTPSRWSGTTPPATTAGSSTTRPTTTASPSPMGSGRSTPELASTPCGSGPTPHLPPRQAARRCSPA